MIRQTLCGLYHLHKNNIIHRDLKLQNLLLDEKGNVKLADFGLARIVRPSIQEQLTYRVVTLWYRAPELILGCREYSFEIDMWSIGVIIAEILIGRPIFACNEEVEEIQKIWTVMGDPEHEDNNWPEVRSLHFWQEMKPKNQGAKNTLKKYLEDKCIT